MDHTATDSKVVCDTTFINESPGSNESQVRGKLKYAIKGGNIVLPTRLVDREFHTTMKSARLFMKVTGFPLKETFMLLVLPKPVELGAFINIKGELNTPISFFIILFCNRPSCHVIIPRVKAILVPVSFLMTGVFLEVKQTKFFTADGTSSQGWN
jgi:hypothetical protein